MWILAILTSLLLAAPMGEQGSVLKDRFDPAACEPDGLAESGVAWAAPARTVGQ